MTLTPTKREGAGVSDAIARFVPEPGAVVAEKYRVERTLGEGGMGVVVLATHLGLDQRVAIKVLQPDSLRNSAAGARFMREAKLAAKLQSDYVARVYDVGTLEDGLPFIVMEYLEGTDLGALIRKGEALPVEEVCEIALQACEALVEVHAAGIVHRDLKPSNLFVVRRTDGSPAVKLLDFGISKLATSEGDASTDPTLTATTAIMGSPAYMSPEQLKSTKEVDYRTDIWSLGAVLYEAVTGKPPFRGETVPQVCAMIASEDPEPPSSQRAEVSPELDQAILGCLNKNSDERMRLVELARVLAEFAPERARASLERIEAGSGEPTPATRPPTPSRAGRGDPLRRSLPGNRGVARTVSSWGKEKRVPSRRRGTLAALAFFFLLGGAAVAVLMGRFQGPGIARELSGASNAVTSAASAVSSAAGVVASAVASSLPELPEVVPEVATEVAPEPNASASAGEREKPSEVLPQRSTPPPAGTAAAASRASGQHTTPQVKHQARPHHAAKPWHHHN